MREDKVLTPGVLAVIKKDITLEDRAYAIPYWPSVYLGRRCNRAAAAKVAHILQVQVGAVKARSFALRAFAVRYDRGLLLLWLFRRLSTELVLPSLPFGPEVACRGMPLIPAIWSSAEVCGAPEAWPWFCWSSPPIR